MKPLGHLLKISALVATVTAAAATAVAQTEEGAQDRPLLRGQPLFLDRPAASFVQHVCTLVETKEQPVG